MNSTILIVEDEVDILELMEYTLQKEGYETIGFVKVSDTLYELLDEEQIDLILMDRNLPGIEGTSFISDIRSKGYNTPVIYVTAKDKDEDILNGFDNYADDYITKPFKIKEFVARIKALLKRTKKEVDTLKVRDITYIRLKKRFEIDGKKVDLTQLEGELLLEFMKNKDILLSREYLLEHVWDDSLDTQLKTVNVAIKRLKGKIDPDGKKDYIKAVRGEGYMFC